MIYGIRYIGGVRPLLSLSFRGSRSFMYAPTPATIAARLIVTGGGITDAANDAVIVKPTLVIAAMDATSVEDSFFALSSIF